MHPQFSNQTTEQPLRIDANGVSLMPEWSDDDLAASRREHVAGDDVGVEVLASAVTAPEKVKGVRTPRPLQPDASQMSSVTQAKEWLDAHPEEAKMLREAHAAADILTDSDTKRWYSSPECAAFFDKTVQWLYWGMRRPPNGGRLFVEPWLEDDGKTQRMGYVDKAGDAYLDESGEPITDVALLPPPPEGTEWGDPVPLIRDIPVEWIGEPKKGKRRFDIPTIRKFARSAYYRGNIKEPKLTAVLQRLVVAERGGNWKVIPIPQRPEDEEEDE